MSQDALEDRAVAALLRDVTEAARRPGAARTLLLDVDGTLAPLAETPGAAVVPGSTIEALQRLSAAGWTIVAVSGRPAEQVRRMLPVESLLAFGSHGAEPPDGMPGSEAASAPEALRRLEGLRAGLGELAAAHPGVLLESKPRGLAIHDRALAEERERAWREALSHWLAGQDLGGLELLEGKRVVELRPRGANKGSAVSALASRLRITAEDRSFVALGDDVTDEDMFREMRGRGLAVRVGAESAHTLATRTLGSTRAVGEFLRRLADPGSCADPVNAGGAA